MKAVWASIVGATAAGLLWSLADTPTAASIRNRLHPLGLNEHPVSSVSCAPNGTVAAVLRNDGSGWYAIDDADHKPTNIAAVETSLFGVTVRYAYRGRTVRTFIAAPDETLAAAGFTVGASVGLDRATITLGRAGIMGAHRVSPALVTTATYPLSNIWIYGLIDGDC